ncbi:hypothetical protein BDZ97DRAFT_1911610 [Flammula alnicola]|nr:hypothetical protein BDZ97DRAFT_1911610 [Flammula alnicola]
MSYSAATSSYSIFPTTSSASPSFNLFIPSTAASSRETHEMYAELGFVFRPSNRQTSYGSTKSNGSIKSKASRLHPPNRSPLSGSGLAATEQRPTRAAQYVSK